MKLSLLPERIRPNQSSQPVVTLRLPGSGLHCPVMQSRPVRTQNPVTLPHVLTLRGHGQ